MNTSQGVLIFQGRRGDTQHEGTDCRHHSSQTMVGPMAHANTVEESQLVSVQLKVSRASER